MKYKLLVCTSAFLLLGSQAWAQTAGDTSKGKVWVDDKGMTLYTFDKDTPGKSTCNGACAQNWPPLPAGRAPVASGDWTAVTRDDGGKMWAYKGKPVYTYVNDKAPGDTNGDGANGGTWRVAKP